MVDATKIIASTIYEWNCDWYGNVHGAMSDAGKVEAALHEAGYVIVPKVETDKMDEAGTEAYLKISGWNCSVQVVAETVWRAMIAAAEDE